MKRKSAFTLIELLVVISIIAILAGLLMPTLLRVLEKGKSTEDLNNLKNIGQAMVSYMSDQKGSYFSLNADGGDVWPKSLQSKYAKDWKTFRSPFDTVSTSRPKADHDPIPVSYGMNKNLFDTFEGKWKAPVSSLIAAAAAVDTDSPGKAVKFRQDAVSTNNITIEAKGSSEGLGTFQNRESTNVLFADWHVSTMDWKKFSDNSSEKGKEQWDPLYEQQNY
jgi:prepilin-type N-terminal cleavage/methylation domain-containing protein/prepilin-type processing-associated H-X9-DG protein